MYWSPWFISIHVFGCTLAYGTVAQRLARTVRSTVVGGSAASAGDGTAKPKKDGKNGKKGNENVWLSQAEKKASMAWHPQSRNFRKQSKRAEYERLSSLPASREEVLEALCFYVDFEARTFPSHLAAQVKKHGDQTGGPARP
jgi:hypothetical protein